MSGLQGDSSEAVVYDPYDDNSNDPLDNDRNPIYIENVLTAVNRELTTLELETQTNINNLKKAKISDHDPRLLVAEFVAVTREFFELLFEERGRINAGILLDFRSAMAEVDLTSRSPTHGLQPLLMAMKRIGVYAREKSSLPSVSRNNLYGIYQNAHAQYNNIAALEVRMETESIRGDVAELAGQVSTGSLSEDFKSFADSEYKQANIFRALAIVALLVAFGVGAYIAAAVDVLEWTTQLLKLLIDIPLLLLAYYFSSESKDHRANGRRAREWQVRLNTIRAYTAELPEVDRYRVRTEMGLAVFREPASLAMSDAITDGKVLGQVADVLRAARGNE